MRFSEEKRIGLLEMAIVRWQRAFALQSEH